MPTATKSRPRKAPAAKKAPTRTPKVDASSTISVRLSSAQIGHALRCAALAASKDRSRPILCGVYMVRRPHGLDFVTTDNYRLYVIEVTLDPDVKAHIPDGWTGLYDLDPALLRWVLDICKTPGKVDCELSPSGWKFTGSNRTVTLPSLKQDDGPDYPKYEGLIPVDRKVEAGAEVGFNARYLSQMGSAATAGPLYRAGKLRLLALAAPQRSPEFPDVPTVAESGGPKDFAVTGWNAIAVPPGLPAAVTDKIKRDIEQALTGPDVAEKFKTFGYESFPTTRAQFDQFVKDEAKRFGDVIRQANVSLD